jgi:lipopolysaccharide export system protein LptC
MSDLAHPTGMTEHLSRPTGPPPRGAARRYGFVVRTLRWLLPLIMVGITALLVGLVIQHSVRRHAASHREGQAPIRMLNPKFFGRDNQGRPYVLGASQAARDETSLEVVRLRNPTITLDMDGPHPSTLTADTGVYREDTRILDLKGHVKADNAHVSKFATDEAVVDTRTGVVTGPEALSSQTPVGDLQSRSFDVFDKGNRVVFKGGVHARLNGR